MSEYVRGYEMGQACHRAHRADVLASMGSDLYGRGFLAGWESVA